MTGDYAGDDIVMTPWVMEHGKHLPAVLVAECSAPDAALFGLVLPHWGWTFPARVQVRPPTVPGWIAEYCLSSRELTITQANGTLFYIGELPELPERWDYAARELGWCVLYLVIGTLPDSGDPQANAITLHKAADEGRVFSARVLISPVE